MNQLMAVPIAIARQMRKPTNNPEPKLNKLMLKPMFMASLPGMNQVSRIHLKNVVTIIKAPDLDAALEWARRYALVTTLPVEVRPFQGEAEG